MIEQKVQPWAQTPFPTNGDRTLVPTSIKSMAFISSIVRTYSRLIAVNRT